MAVKTVSLSAPLNIEFKCMAYGQAGAYADHVYIYHITLDPVLVDGITAVDVAALAEMFCHGFQVSTVKGVGTPPDGSIGDHFKATLKYCNLHKDAPSELHPHWRKQTWAVRIVEAFTD